MTVHSLWLSSIHRSKTKITFSFLYYRQKRNTGRKEEMTEDTKDRYTQEKDRQKDRQTQTTDRWKNRQTNRQKQHTSRQLTEILE